MIKLSFVIPCYNSEHTIRDVINEIQSVIDGSKYDYEIILVNDCSKDHVWQVIEDLTAKNQRIKGISFARNFGQQSALLAGYRHVSGDIIVSMDDDGQAPLDSLNTLLDKLLDEDFDIVYGCYEHTMQNKFRNLGSWVNRKMGELMLDRPKDLNPTSFFVVRRFIIDEITQFENCYAYISGLVFRSTRNIGGVTVKHRKRAAGQSGYSFKKLVALWINGFTAFSVKPLRLATLLGFFFSTIGLLYGVYIVIDKLVHPSVLVGYSSLMAVLLFMGGVLMFIMGMVGEYIGRIYINQNKSPQYVIRETINFE